MDTKVNIRQFKLLNGEEIIALVNQRESDHYIVERPFAIKPHLIGGWAFVPWFPFSSQKLFKIAKENIMYHVEIDEEIKTEYIRLAATDTMKPKLQTEMTAQERMMDDLESFIEENKEELSGLWEEEDNNKIIH